MKKENSNKSSLIQSILLLVGLGCGVYFSFIFGLYQLEKKESNTIVSPTTILDSPIQNPFEVNKLLHYYLRNVK